MTSFNSADPLGLQRWTDTLSSLLKFSSFGGWAGQGKDNLPICVKPAKVD